MNAQTPLSYTGSDPQIPKGHHLPIPATLAARVLPWLAGRVQSYPSAIQMLTLIPATARHGVATMWIRRPADFCSRVATAGVDGFCESYQAGDWNTDDLPLLLTNLIEHSDGFMRTAARGLQRSLRKPRTDNNEDSAVERARQNVSYHYDISNDLFSYFLVETMTYSAALFEEDARGKPVVAAELLAEAQRRKVDRLLDLTGVGEGTRLLEIGTGWGYLAVQAAHRGARVKTITLSAEQAKYAQRRVVEAGVADLVAVELCDFQQLDLGAKYDAVISVEMIEAIGERLWPAYFSVLDRVLDNDGRIGLQVMTMRHDRFLGTRQRQSWLNKHVLPGFLMPSVPALVNAIADHSSLTILNSKPFGQHFAATLRIWREKFQDQAQAIDSLGFENTFIRTWYFFLASCEASFQTGLCDVYIKPHTWPKPGRTR